MGKNTLQTLKGFRDFLPVAARKRAWLRAKMIEVFEKYGYEPLETPALEPLELFEGEIGEDEKLFYKFEDAGGRKVALRYDQTVPTVRVIGQYLNELTLPFRRYQIQSCFRAEKPQKGRFREFVQADIDIYGVASPIADAEAIAVSIELYRSLGFEDVIAYINNRDLMKDIPYTAISAIDKLDKIGVEGVTQEMIAKGMTGTKAKEYLEKIKNIKPDETLKIIFDYFKASGIDKRNYEFKPTLARSFSYSEGPIWEMVVPGYEAGSVGGGERYDGMVKRITGLDVPATGIAFGFDRTLEAAEQMGLIPEMKNSADVLVSVFNNDLLFQSIKVAQKLRDEGLIVEIYPDPEVKLEKQLKYADKKGIKKVIIIGPDEAKEEKVVIKNMQSGEQVKLDISSLIEKLSNVEPTN